MARAEGFGCERDHSDVPEDDLSVTVIVEPVTHLSATFTFKLCTCRAQFTLLGRPC